MTPPELAPLLAAVRTNCHISDARHARDLTLCTYLLEMRELYRWEHGIAFGGSLPQAAVGAWIAAREEAWTALEDAAPVPLPVAGRELDPYDVEGVNEALDRYGLVYGAGIGRFGKPQFFLAALAREEQRDGIRVRVAGREHARDLSGAPAASREGTIFVRLESLERWLWERAEAWRARPADGSLQAALDAYGMPADSAAAMRAMVSAEAEALVLHELGECRAAGQLGGAWECLLLSLTRRRTEVFVRAVRDHLADCLVTLPVLLERNAAASLHFWIANLQGMRRALFPAAVTAYESWRRDGSTAALADTADTGTSHWLLLAQAVLAAHAQGGEDAIDALAAAPTTPL